jgi:hypothetical protein
MLLLFFAQAAVAQLEIAPAQVAQQPLNLTCFGGGTAKKGAVATVNTGSDLATITHQRQQGFADQVDIRLFNGDDRIRLPRTTLPLIRGGNDGWFKLKNVVADARTIRAKAAVNFINNPTVHIDRVTGTISISGKNGDYAGTCEAMATDAPAKF